MGSRSETTRVFARPDGSMAAEIHSGVVRVADGFGGWKDVDLNLEKRPDGTVASRVHPKGLVLSGAAGPGEHDLAVLGKGDERVAMGWRGRLPEPRLDGAKATYPDVRPGVDLVVEVTRSGYETFLIVKNRAAAAQVATVALPWRTGKLSSRAAAGRNGLELTDTAGEVVGGVAEPHMWDARVNPRTGEPLRRVPVGMTRGSAAAGKTDLVLTPDAAFLSDPSTEYPVTIDPQQSVGQTQDTWVQCAWSSSLQRCVGNGVGWNSVELKLGTWNDGGENARSFLSFNYAPFYGVHVNWATLNLYETWAWSCTDTEWQLWTTSWFDHTTNWESQVSSWLTYRDSSWQTTGYDSCEPDGWVAIDATEWTQHAVDSGYIYWGLGLKAYQEWPNGAAADSWKRFRSSDSSYGDPVLTINYTWPPSVAAMATSPTMPCLSGSASPHVTSIPQLQAVISDTEGANVTAQYEWWVAHGTSSPIGSTTTGPVASGAWQPAVAIPAADLPDGQSYAWRVRGHDGTTWGAWSGWCEFYLDFQAPSEMATSPPSVCMFTPDPGDTGPLPRLNADNAGAGLTLRARVDDVNGGLTRAQFEWWPKSGPMIGSVTTPAPGLPAGSTLSTTVPAGTFAEGQAYHRPRSRCLR